MAQNLSNLPAGDLTGLAYDGATHDAAQNAGTHAGVDADESMLPTEEGVQGAVGPVTGAQHMPNAAQPGSR